MKQYSQEKFTIFSNNGENYGPVDLITLISWAKDGRLNATSKIVSDLDGKVYRAEDFPELKNIVSGIPPVIISDLAPKPAQINNFSDISSSGGLPVINIINNVQSNNSGFNPNMPVANYEPKSRIVAGILGIFLGWLGIHRFYLGYTGIGTLMLCLSLILPFFTCGIYLYFPFVIIWGLIEGILILCGQIRDVHGMELTN